jgi:hypothetical protein
MGWYYCWVCMKYRKWFDNSDLLDCDHPVRHENKPSYDFNTDDQYELWAENHDSTAPEIDEATRIDPPGYRAWREEWDNWRRNIAGRKGSGPTIGIPRLTTGNS